MTETLNFIEWFKTTPHWQTMVNTVEDSPWHREANVAVHTEMSIEQYLTHFAPSRTAGQNMLALVTLLFHDTGKPAAEEVVESETRGTYRRYAGHEQDSAVTFTEIYLTYEHVRNFITVEDARKIRWMIEHHLPYGLKDGKKRSDLRTAMEHTLREDVQTFYDVLRSDAAGRISDDHEAKLQNVEDWIDEFRTVPLTINRTNTKVGKCYIMVGPSGSGKSTWTKDRVRACDKVLSMDTYRQEFFEKLMKADDRFAGWAADSKIFYAKAYEFCLDHTPDFTKYMNERVASAFHDLKITGGDVYIDNTNGSKKARAKWIQEARNVGMKVVAVEFWNTLSTLAARQKTRPDKEVPYSSLKQQYYAQTCAWKGSEVDEVIVVVGQ